MEKVFDIIGFLIEDKRFPGPQDKQRASEFRAALASARKEHAAQVAKVDALQYEVDALKTQK